MVNKTHSCARYDRCCQQIVANVFVFKIIHTSSKTIIRNHWKLCFYFCNLQLSSFRKLFQLSVSIHSICRDETHDVKRVISLFLSLSSSSFVSSSLLLPASSVVYLHLPYTLNVENYRNAIHVRFH